MTTRYNKDLGGTVWVALGIAVATALCSLAISVFYALRLREMEVVLTVMSGIILKYITTDDELIAEYRKSRLHHPAGKRPPNGHHKHN